MYEKVVILFCAATVVLAHNIEVTTPTSITTAVPSYTSGPVITSYSSPAPVSNKYLPVPEVNIGTHYNKHSSAYSVGSNYVPVHVGHSAYQPVSSYGHSLNFASTTQATPIYSTAAPVYSTTPSSFQSRSTFVKSYPAVSYGKSTIAPTYSYSTSSPVSYVGSYPSYSSSYSHPVKSSYSQPLSYYNAALPTVHGSSYSPASYSTYPAHNYVSYSSSTPIPSLLSSTLGYGSSSALGYSVSPTVASYSTPSPSYSIQVAPLKAQFSYAVPSPVSYSSHQLAYGSDHLVHGVGVPYHGGHESVQYVSEPQYSSWNSGHHGENIGYSSEPIISNVNYGHGLKYGWKK